MLFDLSAGGSKNAGAAVKRRKKKIGANNKMLDRRAVELLLISLLAVFCGGLAWALDHELFGDHRAFFVGHRVEFSNRRPGSRSESRGVASSLQFLFTPNPSDARQSLPHSVHGRRCLDELSNLLSGQSHA